MKKGSKKSKPTKFSEGELRRFELLTTDSAIIKQIDKVIKKRKLTRMDLGLILLYLHVRPEYGPEAFGIWPRNNQAHP